MEAIKAREGIALSLISAVGFSLIPILARLAADAGVPGFQVVLVNELANVFLFIPLAIFCKAPLRGNTWKQTLLMIGTGTVRVIAASMSLLSSLYIPPAATIAIGSGMKPFTTAIISWLILRESVGWENIMGIIIQVTGVGLVAGGMHLRTTADQANNLTDYMNTTVPANVTFGTSTNIQNGAVRDFVIGVVLAFLGTLGLVITNVMSRSFLQNVAQLTVLVFVEGLGFFLVLPIMFIFNTPVWDLDVFTIASLTGQGTLYSVSICCMYRGLKLEKASTVEILRGVAIALAYVFQFLILHIVAVLIEYLGATVIAISIVLVATLGVCRSSKNNDNPVNAQTSNDGNRDDIPTVDGTINMAMDEL
uniref:EamA domain-containing protein n=1 Tax=Branchiostoma floridae TaxID=7739 RepID=C3YVL0_BRAFL|eukprot:XP_002599721.1 hypothetical protein BRAFLDRAFT_106705 [Branchiostoma floridae]